MLPVPATPRLTNEDFDRMSVDDLTAVVLGEPGEKHRIEKRLVSQGRTADVYALSRRLAPPPPSPEMPTAPAAKEPATVGAPAPAANAKPETSARDEETPVADLSFSASAEATEALPVMLPLPLPDFTALDALTAERIARIEALLRMEWRQVWASILSSFSFMITSLLSHAEILSAIYDDTTREEREERRPVSTSVSGDRMVVTLANGDVLSFDIGEDGRVRASRTEAARAAWWRRAG